MKRTIVLALALLITLGLILTGCSGKGSANDSSTTQGSQSIEDTQNTDGTYSTQSAVNVHVHEWAEATCVSPKTCIICGKTEGTTVEHTFYDRICIHCNSQKGSEGLTFELADNSYTVTGIGTCTDTDIVIPSTFHGLPVTRISDGAFADCQQITSVVIPNSVTFVSNEAFLGCPKLAYNQYDNAYYLGNIENPYLVLCRTTSIDISSCEIHPDARIIVKWAFTDHKNLEEIKIPQHVLFISEYSFDGCSNLSEISVSSFNKTYHSSGNCLIETETRKLIAGCQSSVIPHDGSVQIIGAGSFAKCDNLTGIQIPSGVTSIEAMAFANCDKLTDIEIPSSITFIDSSAFIGTKSLNYYSYNNANYLGNPNDPYILLFSATSIEITSCNVHESTKFIWGNAFQNCHSLESIFIPDSVEYIYSGAFSTCASLTEIILPKRVTKLYAGIFEDCSNLANIILPEDLIQIEGQAFRNCTRLTQITIPSTVTEIGNNAFNSCNSLNEVYFAGTMEQWENIPKPITFGRPWRLGCAANEIICSDGTVPLN